MKETKKKKIRSDGIRDEDLRVLRKIIYVLPDYDDDKPPVRFARAKAAFLHTMLSGCSDTRGAHKYACYMAANGNMADCYLAINAIWFMPEFVEA